MTTERPKVVKRSRFVQELIDQRALTMEDGRPRGILKPERIRKTQKPVKPGPDDGERLG